MDKLKLICEWNLIFLSNPVQRAVKYLHYTLKFCLCWKFIQIAKVCRNRSVERFRHQGQCTQKITSLWWRHQLGKFNRDNDFPEPMASQKEFCMTVFTELDRIIRVHSKSNLSRRWYFYVKYANPNRVAHCHNRSTYFWHATRTSGMTSNTKLL